MFRSIGPGDLRELTPQKICIIKPSALGDVVQALPLLTVLKSAWPDAAISWVINRELEDLVTGHPSLSEVIPFDRRGNLRDWFTLLSTLRSRQFDLVFDLQGLLRTAVMTAATGARTRVGFQTAREGSHFTVNCTIPDTGRNVPAHARLWRLAETLGFADVSRKPVIVTSDADRQWVDGILGSVRRPVIAVHPGAGWETKRWPVEKFAALLERSFELWGGSAVILGSRGERPHAERLEHLLRNSASPLASEPPSIVNVAGQTSLKQLAALLDSVDIVISNDSGPMHLAAALETPTLGIFTCTSATISGPAGTRNELVSTNVSCAASYCKKCPHKGGDYLSCLKELDVDRAWLALQRLAVRIGFERPHHRAA